MALNRKRCILLKFIFEIIIRIALIALFLKLENLEPFKRKIHQDEIWLYRNPITQDYVPVRYLWLIVIFIPIFGFVIHFVISKDKLDLIQAHLGLSLTLGLNGVLTDIIKLVVGRPRPDFFWRCFPEGEMNSEMECTGNLKLVNDGRKSFPSGHSSFSFAGMGFLTFYLLGKCHIFDERGRGQSWRIILCFLPVFSALLVAISRTCDYHHHWQDIVIGSLIGLWLSYFCYRQYYPPVDVKDSHRPYSTGFRSSRGEKDCESAESSEREDSKINQCVLYVLIHWVIYSLDWIQ